jgi:hypothetical protein
MENVTTRFGGDITLLLLLLDVVAVSAQLASLIIAVEAAFCGSCSSGALQDDPNSTKAQWYES